MNMPSRSTNEVRRERAVRTDSLTSEVTSLSRLWGSLLSAEKRVTDAFFTSERCYLILHTVRDTVPRLTPRQRCILERSLCGECQNTLAIDLGVAASTVAMQGRDALRIIGVSGRPSRCHPLLMLAAMAAVANEQSWGAASSTITEEDRSFSVVSIARPESSLRGSMPSAELDVLRGLVEGLCYRDISERRQTALRTIANQATSAFRRFRVSGRNELVCHLLAKGMRTSPSLSPLSVALPINNVSSSRACAQPSRIDEAASFVASTPRSADWPCGLL